MNEISYIEKIKWIPVSDKEQAQGIFSDGKYTEAWFYKPRKNTKWLIVREEEYKRNQ
jgi:hypothetical protein